MNITVTLFVTLADSADPAEAAEAVFDFVCHGPDDESIVSVDDYHWLPTS